MARLKAHELVPGQEVYFCESRSYKQNRFKKCIVKELYQHHILVEVQPTSPRAKATYNTSLGVTSINCGDIIVQDEIKPSEAFRLDDVMME